MDREDLHERKLAYQQVEAWLLDAAKQEPSLEMLRHAKELMKRYPQYVARSLDKEARERLSVERGIKMHPNTTAWGEFIRAHKQFINDNNGRF